MMLAGMLLTLLAYGWTMRALMLPKCYRILKYSAIIF